LSTHGSCLPEAQLDESNGAQTGQIASDGLVDLSGFTLSDLRDLRDSFDESCLSRALSRVMATSDVGEVHGFQSKI
jgi:hypothetical protein